jgi:hypothetical protein
MESVLRRLIDVYIEERDLYGRIRDHVLRQRTLIEQRATYAEINEELVIKRDLLLRIEKLEGQIRQERSVWQRRKHELDGGLAGRLMLLLAEVSQLVEEIITMERENEILLTSRRRNLSRPTANQEEVARNYANHSLVEVER